MILPRFSEKSECIAYTCGISAFLFLCEAVLNIFAMSRPCDAPFYAILTKTPIMQELISKNNTLVRRKNVTGF